LFKDSQVLHHRNLAVLKTDATCLSCNGVASAFVGDISCADLLVTDSGADPSVLANLRPERLKVVTADPGAG
jgi:hypothetical protein